MKKYIVSGFALVVLIFVALFLWQHFKPSRDAEIRKNLPGTWVVDMGHGGRTTTTVSPDDSYVSKMTGLPDGRVIVMRGTFQVTNGLLIDTQTYNSQKKAQMPDVTREQIVRADAHQMSISVAIQGAPSWSAIMRKVAK